MQPVYLGLIGCGTVGTGVARLLLEQRQLLVERTGIVLELKYVADTDQRTDRGIAFAPGVFIDDAWRIINDPQVDIVIEMIGGQTVARDLIMAAIRKGKHVVTANKALLANHGNELLQAASAANVDLAFEASVAGCIPIIKTLREALVGNEISSMIGILNGTCNYILSQITEADLAFETALSQAQSSGYAEADPTLDIEGVDTAHKLAIITALAYGTRINFEDIYIEGISSISPLDIQLAKDLGYRIKLLAISKNHGHCIEARVHPAMIPTDNILSNVTGSLNAITVSGHAVQNLFLSGRGAGMLPTASAVLSDIVDLARNLRHGGAGRVPALGYQPDKIRQVPVLSMNEIVSHYYIRFAVQDRPGVLAAIAGILGDNGISIQSVQQKDRKTNGWVPIVMLTHHAKEVSIQKALREIGALDVVGPAPVLIRIEDDNPQK
jgi:homoserine dehydrogenase